MIQSFGDSETEKIWRGTFSKKLPPEIQRTARRKMIQIDGSVNLDDLKVPPGNQLHELAGDLKSYHSIRINNQWRIIFRWIKGHAESVKITDYH